MGWVKETVAGLALVVVCGCAVGTQGEYMMSPDGANYTDMYISYSIYDVKGKPFWLGGDAKPFNKGGQLVATAAHYCQDQGKLFASFGMKIKKATHRPRSTLIQEMLL
jgi:hypothetical protein